jgi:beta-N-acetylhexosaminidase
MTKAAIIGLAGQTLSEQERKMLRAEAPAGVILFARNIADLVQLAALTTELRDLLGPDAVLMVDQEGGRVARLRPPHWRAHPPAATLGALPERAAWLTGALIGLDCAAAGFNVVCAPVLDLRIPGAHDVIGDRAFSTDPAIVARHGRAMAAGLLAAGVQPVMKHMPGHGRATADSHFLLPRVETGDLADDLMPFRENAGLPWAMTAHILYTTWDTERPATLSPTIIGARIRGEIGFQGVLIADDLTMQALSGEPAALAQAALAAGCDLALHCSGKLEETIALLHDCPPLTAAAEQRLQAAREMAARCKIPLDGEALDAERALLLA